jgi:hypothetical protein
LKAQIQSTGETEVIDPSLLREMGAREPAASSSVT